MPKKIDRRLKAQGCAPGADHLGSTPRSRPRRGGGQAVRGRQGVCASLGDPDTRSTAAAPGRDERGAGRDQGSSRPGPSARGGQRDPAAAVDFLRVNAILICARRGSLVSSLPGRSMACPRCAAPPGCPGARERGLIGACRSCSIEACPPPRAPGDPSSLSSVRSCLGMVMIGTDSHKRTHTVVALDDVGRRLGAKTCPHQRRRAP